jgi:NAD(P)H dehydrogenase (quinone)
MTIYGVTGATGGFGSHVIRVLLGKAVAPENIVAIARDLAKTGEWDSLGLDVRLGDFDAPSTLESALDGVDILLLVSTGHVPNRVMQHKAAIDAAIRAGVERIVYTSVLQADTSKMGLAADHLATEQLLAAAPLNWTILRNSWYLQLYVGDLPGTLKRGMTIGSAGDGRVSAAPREDYAEAAATVMLEPGHEDTIYELGGDTSFSYTDFAQTLSRLSGITVGYTNLTPAAHRDALVAAGLPEDDADVIVDSDQAIPRGELETTSHDLSRLIHRPTTSATEFLTGLLHPDGQGRDRHSN